MSEYKTTLIGLESSYNNLNKSLFDNMRLPAGIDKQVLIDSILMRSGEFEVLYCDPELMSSLINIWSRKYYDTFDRWIKALNIKYDPLNNYDRYEEIDDNTKSKENNKNRIDNKGSSNVKSDVKTDDDTTTDFSESAYNVTTPVDKNKTETEEDIHTVTGTEGKTSDVSDSNGSKDQNTDYKRRAHLFGNIGVTTSQQMLNSELELGYWNIYNKITDLFIREFLLLVY